MKKIVSLFFAITFALISQLRADEGMWIPLFLGKYNIADMQKKGFKLTAEDIYSVNHASMKDAVMIFGGGCTAELVSGEGLIITNHHCGYGQIQQHSSLEHDYLTDGFWAMKRSDELANPSLTVTFLVRMEDVTKRVLADVTDQMSDEQRQKTIAKAVRQIESEAKEGNQYEARVKPFFYGNEFYLFVTEIFRDVRLVGAPPSAIGKFGGDTDNWMWPRHTGDFSVFRIYADKDNKPAKYSPDNVPYKPKKFFPISMKGVQKGDFTMVFGYPGTTEEYLPSYAIDLTLKVENPHKIKIRQKKIDIMSAAMNDDREIRIQYSNKYARVSNAWKKWMGESRGLERADVVAKKTEQEKKFTDWVNQDSARKAKYGWVLPRYKAIYEGFVTHTIADSYFSEAAYSLDIFQFASKLANLAKLTDKSSQEDINKAIETAKGNAKVHFKDYNLPTDKKIVAALLKMYYENVDKQFHPEIFKFTKLVPFQTPNNEDAFNGYADYLFANSILVDQKKFDDFINNFNINSVKQIQNDPAVILYSEFLSIYFAKINPFTSAVGDELNKLNRFYMAGLREWQKDKVFYPDANSTLRVSFGNVDDYFPRDGVKYLHYTTIEGIIDKDNPEIYDYRVPQRLKELYKTRDFGGYDENEQMHVCFLATNHTTGGNSGSPVLNANGELIGVNFDRVWEGTMSDLNFDPTQCRNITLDIRYALFIIDKFAGASHLIKEMTLVK